MRENPKSDRNSSPEPVTVFLILIIVAVIEIRKSKDLYDDRSKSLSAKKPLAQDLNQALPFFEDLR